MWLHRLESRYIVCILLWTTNDGRKLLSATVVIMATIAAAPMDFAWYDFNSIKTYVGCYGVCRNFAREPLFSLGKGNKRAPDYLFMLTLKRKEWSSPDLQKEESGPSPCFKKGKDKSSTSCSKQDEESFLQATLGKRRKLLSRRKLLYLLVRRLLFSRRVKKPPS